jgi:membrane-associated phospholipid phosphatase
MPTFLPENEERRDWWRHRICITVALTLLYSLYFPLSHLSASMNGYNPGIGLDEATPLMPAWMLIYATVFPVGFLPIFVIRDKALMRATALACASALCIAFVVFLAFPVQMDLRPESVPTDSFFQWALGLTYWADAPSNCLPSLHVALSILGGLCCFKADRLVGGIALVFAVLIAPSTMLVKQHYFADVVTGVALALGVYWAFVARLPEERMQRPLALPRKVPAIFAGAFCTVILFCYFLYRTGWAPWAVQG